jgi:PEP-CTERM motif-containing protein
VSGSSGSPDYLFSNAIGGTTTGGSLTIYVTETGLTQNAEQQFLSSFTSNNLPAGATVTETTYLDTNNGTFTTTGGSVTQLASQTFTAFGAVQDITNLGAIPGTFSLTEVYTITEPTLANGANFNATIDVSAVPEASTWAMLIFGFLGVGFTAYRRKFGSFRVA